MAWKLFAILVGTVALEEILFRGVLFAAWGGEVVLSVAVAASSVTFGPLAHRAGDPSRA